MIYLAIVNIDESFGVTIPKEILDVCGLKRDDGVEFLMDENCIIVRKYIGTCDKCDRIDELRNLEVKYFCKKCSEGLNEKKMIDRKYRELKIASKR